MQAVSSSTKSQCLDSTEIGCRKRLEHGYSQPFELVCSEQLGPQIGINGNQFQTLFSEVVFCSVVFMMFLLWVIAWEKKQWLPKSYLILTRKNLYKNPSLLFYMFVFLQTNRPTKKNTSAHPIPTSPSPKKTSLPHQVGPKNIQKPVLSGVIWVPYKWPKIKWVSLGLKYHHTKKRGPQFITIGSDVHLPHHRSPTPPPNRRHPRLPRSPPLGDPLDFQRRRPWLPSRFDNRVHGVVGRGTLEKNEGLRVWSKEYMEKWVILLKVMEFQICSIPLILRIWWWMIESIPYTCTVIWKTFWHWWFNDP